MHGVSKGVISAHVRDAWTWAAATNMHTSTVVYAILKAANLAMLVYSFVLDLSRTKPFFALFLGMGTTTYMAIWALYRVPTMVESLTFTVKASRSNGCVKTQTGWEHFSSIIMIDGCWQQDPKMLLDLHVENGVSWVDYVRNYVLADIVRIPSFLFVRICF
jgi:hypothetical protein